MRQLEAMCERLYEGGDDPWRLREGWYENRKRRLTLDALPDERYRSAFEPGCSNGALSEGLAERCDRLLISDGVAAAVDSAARRTASFAHVTALQAWMPRDWPSGSFDLVVLSELGYYLEASDLEALADRCRRSLTARGVVLACHWRHPIDGCALDGDRVHALLAARLGLACLSELRETDFLLTVWSVDARSLASREGRA